MKRNGIEIFCKNTKFAFRIVMISLSTTFACYLFWGFSPNQNEAISTASSIEIALEYPIHITDEGHIIVQVKLAPEISGNFILDTGAGANVLSGKMFKKIEHLATKAGYFTGFRHDGDRLDGEVFEIPFLAIGDIKQSKPIIGVYPPLDNFGIDGLLSLKFFEDKPFTIDFNNRVIQFLEHDDSESLSKNNTTLPITLYKHTNIMLDIFIPIQLNKSIRMLAEFDTGSGYGAYIINPNYIKDLELDITKATEQPYIAQLSGDKRTDTIYELASISVGVNTNEIIKKEVNVIFRDGLIYNALIGSGMFKDHKITIDIPNQIFIVHD